MKKRTLLSGIALILLCALLMTACTPAASEEATEAPAETEAAVAETEAPVETEAAETEAPEETEAPAEAEASTETDEPEMAIQRATVEDTAEVDAAYAPKITTLDSGVQIQRTPNDNTNVYGRVVTSWNNIYMNADNRGCTACHTLEDAQNAIETFHGAVYMGYDHEYTIWTCFGCHRYDGDDWRNAIHTRHMNNSTFQAMNGTCESCHYIDSDGNYQMWDLVKYDVLRGITDLSADTMDVTFDWNQTEITPVEKMYYKNLKSEPQDWLVYDDQITDDIYKNWTVKVYGDVDNPFEMTIEEMIETFGTVTQTMKSHCVISGVGEALIYQAEVTGIPISKIVEYAQAHDDANMIYPTGNDGYVYNMHTQEVIDQEGLLVLEMNGETIPAGQGFPVAFWANEMSAGNFSKCVNEIKIVHDDGAAWALYGWTVDPDVGDYFNKPDMGVLVGTSGQIYAKGETIHLEGYADAWDEPITKVEFSFDHGATWVEQPIENAVTQQWVYWTLDLNNDFDTGSYLIEMRATSLRDDGTERVMPYTAEFLFNVQ